jgi:hypothetical protein
MVLIEHKYVFLVTHLLTAMNNKTIAKPFLFLVLFPSVE